MLNLLRYFEVGEYKFTLLDSIYYNGSLFGSLYALSQTKGSVVDRVSENGDAMKTELSVLASYYRKVEQKIGSESVFAYNSHCSAKERIPYRLLIVNRNQENYQNAEQAELRYLLNNAKQFGITVMHLRKCEDGRSVGKMQSRADVQIHSGANGQFYVLQEGNWAEQSALNSSLQVRLIQPVYQGLARPRESRFIYDLR